MNIDYFRVTAISAAGLLSTAEEEARTKSYTDLTLTPLSVFLDFRYDILSRFQGVPVPGVAAIISIDSPGPIGMVPTIENWASTNSNFFQSGRRYYLPTL